MLRCPCFMGRNDASFFWEQGHLAEFLVHYFRQSNAIRLQQRKSLQYVLELPHVPRPRFFPEQRHFIRVQLPRRGPVDISPQFVYNPLKIFAFPQRRDFHRKHVQPEKQILAEATRRDLATQIAVRRTHEPKIDGDTLVAAERHHRALLQDAQQLALRL